MDTKNFYFIKDKYFSDFPQNTIMKNKEIINGKPHNRPCYYPFKDDETGLFWMIPISSQIQKYKSIYNSKIQKLRQKNKRPNVDTIVFGYVLGEEKAFLIQNMVPVSAEYINNTYLDPITNNPVVLQSNTLERELHSKAKKVLHLQRKGYRLIFPDVLEIEKQLLK